MYHQIWLAAAYFGVMQLPVWLEENHLYTFCYVMQVKPNVE